MAANPNSAQPLELSEQLPSPPHSAGLPEDFSIREAQEFFVTVSPKVVIMISQDFEMDPEEIKVYPMVGGAFNWVMGATVMPQSNRAASLASLCGILARAFKAFFQKPQQEFLRELRQLSRTRSKQVITSRSNILVVRIPRSIDGLTDKELEAKLGPTVAALKTIGARHEAPVPKVLKYSLNTKNSLGLPYMVLERLPGQQLELLWKELNEAQKISALKQYINLVTEIASIEAPPGSISALNMDNTGVLAIQKLPVPPWAIYDSAVAVSRASSIDYQSAADHLLEQCERWHQYHIGDDFYMRGIWYGFSAIIRSLDRQGFLAGPCVLAHGDLREYNLLSEVCGEDEVAITGVLDWDSAIVTPEIMAYAAPFWMWMPVDTPSGEKDKEESVSFEPQTDEDRRIKEAFMHLASDKYKRFAFAPEAVLARRMFHHLCNGLDASWDFDLATEIIQEWETLHPEDGVVLEESDSDSSSDDSDDESDTEESEAESDAESGED